MPASSSFVLAAARLRALQLDVGPRARAAGRTGQLRGRIQKNSQPRAAAARSHRVRSVRPLDNCGPYGCRRQGAYPGRHSVDSYGRWVIDLDRGWSTERLDLEPLAVAHAAELAPLLDDTALHEFTGGAPLSAAALAARYARLAVRRSPGDDQMWGNWVVRARAAGTVAGTVQATLPVGGPAAGPAEVAWVVVRPAQGRGYATEAARSLVALLHEAGWTVVAHIHPGHLASQRVARGAGLSPTADVRDGEVRWVSPPAAAS